MRSAPANVDGSNCQPCPQPPLRHSSCIPVAFRGSLVPKLVVAAWFVPTELTLLPRMLPLREKSEISFREEAKCLQRSDFDTDKHIFGRYRSPHRWRGGRVGWAGGDGAPTPPP